MAKARKATSARRILRGEAFDFSKDAGEFRARLYETLLRDVDCENSEGEQGACDVERADRFSLDGSP